MLRCVFAQSFLNVGNIFSAFQVHAAQTQRTSQKMNVAIGEAGKHQLSAGVDDFRAHAACFLDVGIVADSGNLSFIDGHGLRPRLLGILRIHAAMDDNNVGRLDNQPLRAG